MTIYNQHVVAVNLTSSDMTDITITHYCSDKTATFHIPSLAKGEITASHDFQSVSGHNDSWDIVAKIGSKTVSVRKKQCNVPNENGGTTALVFHKSTVTYATPDDGPCSSKYD